MINLKASRGLISIILFSAGCSGSGIGSDPESPSAYVGCYNYNNKSVININLKNIIDLKSKKQIKVNGILRIRDSVFLFTENQMVFNNNGYVNFTSLHTGYQYEFKKGVSVPTLLLYDESGREFELTKNDSECF
jgi:hypothetical protein